MGVVLKAGKPTENLPFGGTTGQTHPNRAPQVATTSIGVSLIVRTSTISTHPMRRSGESLPKLSAPSNGSVIDRLIVTEPNSPTRTTMVIHSLSMLFNHP